MKYILPMSVGYVKHWGLWEAVREILQNAFDQQDLGGAKVDVRYFSDGMSISTTTGTLYPKSLVLGYTQKSGLEAARGQFGEGYKLALLVLCRLGYEVKIMTGDQVWLAQIERVEEYDSDMLVITATPTTWSDGVTFVIHGPIDRDEIERNIWNVSGILDEPGRVYVGGLFVTQVKGKWEHGYSFEAGQIRLDRDRCMVADFDLAYATSRMWSQESDGRVVGLLEREADDVKYLESFASKEAPSVVSYYSHYVSSYGAETVPVSDQGEIEKAAAAGKKWKLVPELVKKILKRIGSWVLPSTKGPVERLKDLRGHIYGDEALREFDEVILILENMTHVK